MKTKLQAGAPFVWEFHCSLGEKDMVSIIYSMKNFIRLKIIFKFSLIKNSNIFYLNESLVD